MKMICVSVCAETAGELIENIKKAEEFADVIEVRFDCLDPDQIHQAFAFSGSKKPLLLTYRPKEQGGNAEVDLEGRIAFWGAFVVNNAALDKRKIWIDHEYDLKGKIQKLSNPVTINSYHDFKGVPANLEEIYEDLAGNDAVAKIAVQTEEIGDGLALWKLLQKAKTENKLLIPIAMGDAGKWTRILGLAYGAPVTYASLETGKEVAPGQISAADLRDVYRVKELDEETEIYGVIGSPVGHSLSPYMQNEAFKITGRNAVFIPLEVKNLADFIKRFLPESGLNITGLSVTIPHKQEIMKYLDSVDETARKIGAVNTIKIIDGKLHGFNTDARGFIEPLKKAYGDLKGAKSVILGAGGAARACIYALQNEGAEVTVFARNVHKAESLMNDFGIKVKELRMTNDELPMTDFAIVINATPLGTEGGQKEQSVIEARQFDGVSLAFDLVYNPSVTRFMREAESAGVPKVLGGTDMLVAQGAEQFEIWTGEAAPIEEMKSAVLRRFDQSIS